MKKITVLFLAANAVKKNQLGLDEEIRAITEKIRASEHRDLLHLVSSWSVRADDLLQSLNEHDPTIVHFSGHGSTEGEIILVDNSGAAKPVSKVALKSLFKTLRKSVRVVVLNACYSRSQAEAIAETIDCVIGMNAAIGDQAAIVFAASFYRALGFGVSVKEAFEQGKVALQLEGIPEETTPELVCRTTIKPSRIFLLSESEQRLRSSFLPAEPQGQPEHTAEQLRDHYESGSATYSCVQLPMDFLPRGRLAGRIIKDLQENKCVILCSGPGTGKSVLVAQIAKTFQSQCMFYRFQATERDTAPFLSWLVDQLQRNLPEKSQQLKTLKDLLRQGIGNQEAVAVLICKLLYQQQRPGTIYLIMDDYHYITQDSRVQKDFDRLLRILVGQTPAFLRFIIASRTELPTYTPNTHTVRSIGLQKGEAKKLVTKLGVGISNETLEFLYRVLNGYFLAWKAVLDLAKSVPLSERELLSLFSNSAEASHE